MRVDDWDDTGYREPDLEREPVEAIEEVSPLQPCPTCGWHIDFDPFDFTLCDECSKERDRLVWSVLLDDDCEPHERGVAAEWHDSGYLEEAS